MKALISPNEPRETGYRIAETNPTGFPVASPLFWVDCADDVAADQFWYDPANQTIEEFPSLEQPISEGTQDL